MPSLQFAIGKIALLVRSEVVIHTAPLKHWNPYQLRANQNFQIKPTLELHNDLDVSYPSTYTINVIIQLFSGITLIWVVVRQQFHLQWHQNLLPPCSQLCTQWAALNHSQGMLNYSTKTMPPILYLYPCPGATIPTYLLYRHMLLKLVKIHRLCVC